MASPRFSYRVALTEDDIRLFDYKYRLSQTLGHLDIQVLARLMMHGQELIGQTIDIPIYDTAIEPCALGVSYEVGFGIVYMDAKPSRMEGEGLWMRFDFYRQRNRAPGAGASSLVYSFRSTFEDARRFGETLLDEINSVITGDDDTPPNW
jgi:hypothetical protein